MGSWFRDDGGPAFYSYSNRTSVTGDINIIAWSLTFLTIFLAFLIIFPGIRKQRLSTFITVSLSLFVGNIIMITRLGSSWHVASTRITSSYSALSKELITAHLGAYIGLGHVNITLKALNNEYYTNATNEMEDINFNEKFSWFDAHEMGESYHEALVRGLPFPILTVAEYFSLGQEGFIWGGQYRAAGYYGSIILWASFGSWLLMNLLLIMVPRYGAYAMVLTGSFLLLGPIVYYLLLPVNPLVITFEHDKQLIFHFGWSFWLALTTGILCAAVGLSIACIDWIYPHRFSTVIEVDYDTPYDRHIIIEDSHYHRRKRSAKRPVEQTNATRSILRRLSLKKESNNIDANSSLRKIKGLENAGFELEVPSSPWRYPYGRSAMKGATFKRTLSQDSSCSTASSNMVITFSNYQHTPVHKSSATCRLND